MTAPAEYARRRAHARMRLEAFPAADLRLSAMDALIDAEREIEQLRAEREDLKELLRDANHRFERSVVR